MTNQLVTLKHNVLGQADYLRRDFKPCTSHSGVHGLKSAATSNGMNVEILSIELSQS